MQTSGKDARRAGPTNRMAEEIPIGWWSSHQPTNAFRDLNVVENAYTRKCTIGIR